MIRFLVAILVGMALWYVVFVVLGDFWRPNRTVVGPTTPLEAPPDNRGDAVESLPLAWTALDDRQLIRLLKGAAP